MALIEDPLDAMKINKIANILKKNDIGLSDYVTKDKMQSVGNTLKDQLENFKVYLGELMFDKICAGGSLIPSLDRWSVEVTESNITNITNGFHKKLLEYDATITFEDVRLFTIYIMQAGTRGESE